MDDHPMQKLHRINKEKDFWGGYRKKYPEDQLLAKPNHPTVPPVWACVRLSQPEQGNNPSFPCPPLFGHF